MSIGMAWLCTMINDSIKITKKKRNLYYLDFGLDVFNGIAGLNLQSDGLARKGFNKDLHLVPEKYIKYKYIVHIF